ncbi:MAG: methyltransferase [Solirubrobacterales bacterium]|nr:methyltransferase [Solirubrobacterales bacterium]
MGLLALPGVFRPDGDSAMVAEHLRKTTRPGERVLDVFTGTGVLAIVAAAAGAGEVFAVDVSRRAVFCATVNSRLRGFAVRVRRGSMFEAVEDERFDTITANPPYVPSIDAEARPRGAARAWEGGENGRALLEPFLEQAPSRLLPGGRIIVVHSSLCGIELTLEALSAAGLNARIAASVENPLGPLAAARAELLERRGTLPRGSRTETIAVVEAHSPADLTATGDEATELAGAA